MSSTTIHLYSEWDSLRIECEDDAPVIWIRGADTYVSLNLSKDDRDALRKALDDADAYELQELAAYRHGPAELIAYREAVEYMLAGRPDELRIIAEHAAAIAKAKGETK